MQDDSGEIIEDAVFPGTALKVKVSTRDADYFPNILEQIVREGESVAGDLKASTSKTIR